MSDFDRVWNSACGTGTAFRRHGRHQLRVSDVWHSLADWCGSASLGYRWRRHTRLPTGGSNTPALNSLTSDRDGVSSLRVIASAPCDE